MKVTFIMLTNANVSRNDRRARERKNIRAKFELSLAREGRLSVCGSHRDRNAANFIRGKKSRRPRRGKKSSSSRSAARKRDILTMRRASLKNPPATFRD